MIGLLVSQLFEHLLPHSRLRLTLVHLLTLLMEIMFFFALEIPRQEFSEFFWEEFVH